MSVPAAHSTDTFKCKTIGIFQKKISIHQEQSTDSSVWVFKKTREQRRHSILQIVPSVAPLAEP